ncbi:capsid protein 1 [Galliform chaphamaparvovirus 7]|nr:capsid protein 1 [Galliform chaphamaparvovirus 7]
MAENLTFKNSYMCYIKNQPYIYPDVSKDTTDDNGGFNTGWHVIPNALWCHYTTPKQWANFIINYEAYKVNGFKITLFNMVPMTTQLAIQQTTIFTAFNNTVYGIGYQDKLYETSWYNWFGRPEESPNLAFKEGLMQTDGNVKSRYTLPIYVWQKNHRRVCDINFWGNSDVTTSGYGVFPMDQSSGNDDKWGTPTGIFWDPFTRPEDLMEFRPGKNAMTFIGEVHNCDSEKWFNLDQCMWWHPYTAPGPYHMDRPGQYHLSTETDPDRLTNKYEHTPQINDYTWPNLCYQPVMPTGWMWKELQNSLIPRADHPDTTNVADLRYPGTEYELAKYPFTQCFIKLVPLFDTNNHSVEVTALVSLQMELSITAKKRRSAIYAPTWGPFNWKQLYSARAQHRLFNPAGIRYRTGGARWTWQNQLGTGDLNATGTPQQAHARESPYTGSTVAQGTGLEHTYTITTAKQTNKPNLTVTFSKSLDRVVIQEQQPRPTKRSIFKQPATEPTTVTEMHWDHITHTAK